MLGLKKCYNMTLILVISQSHGRVFQKIIEYRWSQSIMKCIRATPIGTALDNTLFHYNLA